MLYLSMPYSDVYPSAVPYLYYIYILLCCTLSMLCLGVCVPAVPDVCRGVLCIDVYDLGGDCGALHCSLSTTSVQNYFTGNLFDSSMYYT